MSEILTLQTGKKLIAENGYCYAMNSSVKEMFYWRCTEGSALQPQHLNSILKIM